MRIKAFILLVIMAAVVLLGCTPKDDKNEEVNMNNTKQILADTKFQNGFGVMGIQNGTENADPEDVINNSNYTVYNWLDNNGTAKGKYCWRLAQWGTKPGYSFGEKEKYTFTDLGNGKYSYENPAKQVVVDTQKGSVKLTVDASKEFDAPRVNGGSWPHLLIEQVMSDTDTDCDLKGARKFYMQLTVSIDECVSYMSKEEYNTALHAAQCTWYITLNSTKEGVTDYIWFGLPLFDNRNAGSFLGGTVFFDNGQATGTGMLIYGLTGQAFLKKGMNVGDEASFCVDVMPYLKDALQKAQINGLFLDHTINDFTVGSTNLGWEVPGTFKCSMTISDLGLMLE